MPIEVQFACPGCGGEAELPDLVAAAALACACGWSAPRRPGDFAGGRVALCSACGDARLYVQKDFNARVGIGLLVGGMALAVALGVFLGPWGFFGALGGALLLDTLLYLTVGNVVVCHRCEAHYRGGPEDYPEFDLALHDRIRWEKEVARRSPSKNG